ncbi:DNA-binding protein [candidate division KSB1 bacterium]|nr:MAG: DNA-binding protein [candidate division KSB1 bacterium]RPH96659.1 MAG: DNA-binding protein [candidate division KSB1 bacterium]
MTTIKKSPRTFKPPRSGAKDSTPSQTPTAHTPAPGRLLTLTETAFRLGGVHRTTVMRWVKEGRLHCVRLSRKAILFESAEIEKFIREHRSTG